MANEAKLGKLVEGEQGRDAVHVAIVPVTAACYLMPGDHVGFLTPGRTKHVTNEAAVKVGIVDPYLTEAVEEGQRFYLCLYPQTVTSLRHEWVHPAFDTAPPAPAPRATPAPVRDAWRTPTVLGVAQSMRAAKDYTAMPVLADALEEGGYADQQVLKKLRSYRHQDVSGMLLVCHVLGGDLADSAAWLEDFADEVQLSWASLKEAAEQYLHRGKVHCLSFDTPDRVYTDSKEFWKHYGAVTGADVDGREEAFFHCAC